MIASVIGNTLIKEYNQRHGTDYSAEEFFLKIFHPLFYDHERYLQWMTNTPFTAGIKKGKFPDAKERTKRLHTFQEKFDSADFPDYSYAIGFPAVGDLGTTSGQVTDLHPLIPRDEIFASWIGNGLGIRVQGGYCLLFNHSDILWKVYEGWQIYREFIEEYDDLRPNQIDTWNGQWFAYACSEDYDELTPAQGMGDKLSKASGGGQEFSTLPWTEVLFAVADKFPAKQMMGYIYSLGQMNTTIGFVPFQLPDISLPLQFYRELFGDNEALTGIKEIRKLYGTAQSFKAVCQKGVIGTEALEPKDLKRYMVGGRQPAYDKADDEQRIIFNVYQTWLLAMLNNKELWDRANDAATAYLEYVASDEKKVSTKRSNAVKAALDASSRRLFIEANIEIVKNAGETAQKIADLIQEVNLMPEDNFRYFRTLIKFRHAFLRHQNEH